MAFIWRQGNLRLLDRARIKATPYVSRQYCAQQQRGRRIIGTIAAQEFASVGCPRGLAPAHVGKCNARSELTAARIAREQGISWRIQFRDDVRRAKDTRLAEGPLRIVDHCNTPRATGQIVNYQARKFERIAQRNKLGQVDRQLAPGIFESGVPLSVPGSIARIGIGYRFRGGRPDIPVIEVFELQNLARLGGPGVV